jgi:hypothetical protein
MKRIEILLIAHDTSDAADAVNAFEFADFGITMVSVTETSAFDPLTVINRSYDWIIIIHQTLEAAAFQGKLAILFNAIEAHPKLTNYGVINITMPCALHLWQEMARRLSWVYVNPDEALTIAPRELTLCVHSGFLRFQTPHFAKISSLFISSLTPNPDRVYFGLWELSVNSIEHGNLAITYEEKKAFLVTENIDDLTQERLKHPAYEKLYVRTLFDLSGDKTTGYFHICDEGVGFDWQQYSEIDQNRLLDKSGRGIALSRLMSFDEIRYLGTGSDVECLIHFRPVDAAEPTVSSVA